MKNWGRKQLGGAVLKTDLFEEANGDDHILAAIGGGARLSVGVDWAAGTVAQASQRFDGSALAPAVTDLRSCCFAADSFELIVSNSTLDHFHDTESLWVALAELARVLKPGGRLIVTLDNPWNPLYWPLRFVSQRTGPFHLGRTASRPQLVRKLEALGLRVVERDYLIHNPRLVSTGIFYALRKLFGRAANPLVSGALGLFAVGGWLPTRVLTSSFLAVCAEKPR